MAKTVAQLEAILGAYKPLRISTFTLALAQVLPRIYDMGLWRDLTYEISLDGSRGYVSLPEDAAAVLACTINDRPRATRSLYHDVRLTGRHAMLSSYYGIVDDGFYPVLVDMWDAQGEATEDDVTGIDFLYLVPQGSTTTTWTAAPAGTVTVATNYATQTGTQSVSGVYSNVNPLASGTLKIDPTSTFSRIISITYSDIAVPLDLIDPDYSNVVLATIPVGSGVLRFRRFRTSSKDPSTTVHLLVKRGCPSNFTSSTVIHLGSIGAIKNGLLGLIAEDNSDLDRSRVYWTACEKLLDQDLISYMGSAKPVLSLDLSGCKSAGGIHNLY